MIGHLLPLRRVLALITCGAAGLAMGLAMGLAVVLVVGLVVVPTAGAANTDMDCADFGSQAAAQEFFDSAGPGDPHLLDGDGDGVACELLPCPCSNQEQPVAEPTETATPTASPTAAPTTDPNGSGSSGPKRRDVAVVVRVSDGDTLRVQLTDGAEHSVRLIGIDTPEVYGTRECGGPQASRKMRRLAPVGSRIILVSDPSQADTDRYGRLLRYVKRRGRDVGKAQLVAGRARVFIYRDDPFKRAAAYQRAERRAEKRGRGSWPRCWS